MKRIGNCLTSEEILNLFDSQNNCVAPGLVPVSIMSGAGQVETDGGLLCNWGQPGAKCAHNFKVERKLRIRMRHVEGNQEELNSLVKSSHPKQDDTGNF